VTVDIESGYGATAAAVAATVAEVEAIGAAGINLEDAHPESGALRDSGAAAERISAARAASPDLFVNARCDVFMTGPASAEALDDAIGRAQAYAAAGADGIFLPGLLDLAMLETITGALAIPVNVMVDPGAPPIDQLIAVGVRRFSQGIWAFRSMAAEVQRLAADFVADGSYGEGAPPAPPLATLVRN
jgi:2-methylisocitrate lyase-like PEP mutase family enzyme